MRQTAAVLLMCPLLVWSADARAQDDDGGVGADDDAGMEPMGTDDDAGMADAGMQDDGPRVACSCEIVEDRGEEGTVHTCTGTFDEGLCDSFECERSNVLQRACPTTGIDLCCDMGSRGLYTNLYDDCTYPNCEGGFRAQCADFGGIVYQGTCGDQDSDDGGAPEPDDDGGLGGFCSIGTAPGAGSGHLGGAPVALLLGLLALGYRRRR